MTVCLEYQFLIELRVMSKQDQISFASNRQTVQKLKIVMVGDQNAGKSSIIIRYAKNDFEKTNNPTIGIDFTSKSIVLNDRSIRLQLWDTAGQQRFRSLIPSYLKDCNLAIVVYDVTNFGAMENLQKWLDFVKDARGADAHLCIAANKIDLESDIKQQVREAVKTLAKQQGIPHYEISALSGKNIPEMFQQCTQKLIKNTHADPVPETKREHFLPKSKQPKGNVQKIKLDSVGSGNKSAPVRGRSCCG